MDLDTAGNFSNTQAQIFNIGVEMIRKTQVFETGIIKWFMHPAGEHTWQISRYHFTAAHNALKRSSGPTLRNASYHQ